MYYNQVIIGGNVCADPDVRIVDGVKFATMKVAVTERYNDRNGNRHESTEWLSVTASRGTAEIIDKIVRKSTAVLVTGSLQTRRWTDQQGIERSALQIAAQSVQVVSPHRDENDGQ